MTNVTSTADRHITTNYWTQNDKKEVTKTTQEKAEALLFSSLCLHKAKQNQTIVVSVPFDADDLRYGKLVTRGTCAHLGPRGRLVIHLDPSRVFRGCQVHAASGEESVVNVLEHIIVEGPRHRRLYLLPGILEINKVSHLTDDTQRLWRHLFNKKAVSMKGNMWLQDM